MCATPAPPPFSAPAPEMAPDLDLRPGEPTRSTMPRWVQTCRGCGAIAPDLAALPARLRTTIDTPAYRALADDAPQSPFLRWAMLAEALEEPDEAAPAVMQAAWALDDANDPEGAAALRRRAAQLWGQGTTVQDALRVLDAWRRTGDLDAARAQAAHLAARPALEDTDRVVLHFQEGLIATGDTARHLLSAALRPPARTPHVTHGRRPAPKAAPSLWHRLFGR